MTTPHAPEPWPEFSERESNPAYPSNRLIMWNGEKRDFAVITEEQYKHARACVNACAGKTDKDLQGYLYSEGELACSVALARKDERNQITELNAGMNIRTESVRNADLIMQLGIRDQRIDQLAAQVEDQTNRAVRFAEKCGQLAARNAELVEAVERWAANPTTGNEFALKEAAAIAKVQEQQP